MEKRMNPLIEEIYLKVFLESEQAKELEEAIGKRVDLELLRKMKDGKAENIDEELLHYAMNESQKEDFIAGFQFALAVVIKNLK